MSLNLDSITVCIDGQFQDLSGMTASDKLVLLIALSANEAAHGRALTAGRSASFRYGTADGVHVVTVTP